MDSRKLACIVALAGLTACGGTVTPTDGGTMMDGGGGNAHTFPERNFVCAGGAAQPCPTGQPATDDAARTHELPAGAEATYTYVVSYISVDPPDGAPDDQAPGFNIDDLDSGLGGNGADCQEDTPDFIGLAPDSQIGVDNQLGGLLGAAAGLLGDCAIPMQPMEGAVDCLIRSQLADGSLILMVEVTGVNDLNYDDVVMVQLVLGETDGGAAPTLDANGHIAGGQTFIRTMNLGAAVEGDIFNGRLAIEATQFALALEFGGIQIDLPVASPLIRFDIDADGLTNGALGGGVRLADVANIANQVMPGDPCSTAGCADCCPGGAACLAAGPATCGNDMPGPCCPSDFEGQVYDIGGSLADIAPCTAAADCPWEADPAEFPFTCTAVSLGLRLNGVPATIQAAP